MQVRPGTHRAIQDNAEQSRGMQGNAGESRAIQEIAGTHSEKQNNPRDCSAAQIHPGDFQEDTGSVARQGGVLFNKTASAARELFTVRRSALD
jgi:hypothetical protein